MCAVRRAGAVIPETSRRVFPVFPESGNVFRSGKIFRKGIDRCGDVEKDPVHPQTDRCVGIIADQRDILSEVTGKPASGIPQVWALYKEVQDYYEQEYVAQMPKEVCAGIRRIDADTGCGGRAAAALCPEAQPACCPAPESDMTRGHACSCDRV